MSTTTKTLARTSSEWGIRMKQNLMWIENRLAPRRHAARPRSFVRSYLCHRYDPYLWLARAPFSSECPYVRSSYPSQVRRVGIRRSSWRPGIVAVRGRGQEKVGLESTSYRPDIDLIST